MNDRTKTVLNTETSDDAIPSEALQAAQEFADLIRADAQRPRAATSSETYEIRPCVRVRGYILRVPVARWSLWYPTAAAALRFASQLTGLYRAECRIYDEAGEVRKSVPEGMALAGN